MTIRRELCGLLALILALCLLPCAGAEKQTETPELLRVSLTSREEKLDNNRRFLYKEYVVTGNEQVNQELREIADNFERDLLDTLTPDNDKNAKRNSRLDIEQVYTVTGTRWLSVMTLARITYKREAVSSTIATRTYDLSTGERITLEDIFPQDSPAWALMEARVRERIGGLFPEEERAPEAVEELAQNLRDADFTLSGMELTLHYEARAVYPSKPCLMHVRFFYDELWDMMTPAAREQTDNSHWKMVALTCDDGPRHPESTKALNAFRKAGARVTYFTVGKMLDEFEEGLLHQFDNNHIIGSHSMNHWSGYTMKPETRRNDLEQHNELLRRIIGEPATLFRAPGGTFPPWAEAQLGLPIIQWSVDTYDYTGKDANHIFYSIRNNVQDGDIILMHDTGLQLWKAVPIFAEFFQKNGYMMVTVEELARANGVAMQPDTVYYRFLDGQTDQRPDSNIN